MIHIYERHVLTAPPEQRPEEWDRFTHLLIKAVELMAEMEDRRLDRALASYFVQEVEQITVILRETRHDKNPAERRRRIYEALIPIEWAIRVKNWDDVIDGIPRELIKKFEKHRVFIPTPEEMSEHRGPKETAEKIVTTFHRLGSTGTARNRAKAIKRRNVFDIVPDPADVIDSIFLMLVSRGLMPATGRWRAKPVPKRRLKGRS